MHVVTRADRVITRADRVAAHVRRSAWKPFTSDLPGEIYTAISISRTIRVLIFVLTEICDEISNVFCVSSFVYIVNMQL